VPVFSVGSERGVDYYAMQFIEGQSLAALIRDLGEQEAAGKPRTVSDSDIDAGPSSAPPAPPRSGSSTRDRAFFRSVADLGIQAAEALHHAHEEGVVHRDVKPSNLLVDTRGALWVTDFGLARIQGNASMTATGDLLGTLRYMSPEQALGSPTAVDHRTDVYSLGATLYELLTLRPAFDGRDRQEMLRRIANDEPVAPRKVNPSIPRDLETIVLKAMSKEPGGRYDSARELADDLGRFLEDQPIQARRPSLFEHLAKWARRHRAAVTAAASVLIIATFVGAALLWRETQRTQAALTRLQELRQREIKAVPMIFSMSSDMTMTVMGRISMMSGDADKANIYRQAQQFYQGIVELTRAEPEFREIAARAHYGVGFTRMLLRQPGSEEEFREAIERLKDLVALAPESIDLRVRLSDAYNWLGVQVKYTKGFKEAEPYLRQAVEAQRAIIEQSPGYLPQYAGILAQWASTLEAEGRHEEAGRAVDELADLCAKHASPTAVRSISPVNLAMAYVSLGNLLSERNRRVEAEAAYRRGLELDPTSTRLLNDLAWLLVTRPGTSPYDPTRALQLSKKAVAKDPKAGELWNTLGVAHARNGEWKEAADALEKSMNLRGGGDPNDWFFLAMALWHQGDKQRARQEYDRAVAETAKSKKPDADLVRFHDEAKALINPTGSPPKDMEKTKPEKPRRNDPAPPYDTTPRKDADEPFAADRELLTARPTERPVGIRPVITIRRRGLLTTGRRPASPPAPALLPETESQRSEFPASRATSQALAR
jgi:eukaryotic-like serine/threonine-protein kinase